MDRFCTCDDCFYRKMKAVPGVTLKAVTPSRGAAVSAPALGTMRSGALQRVRRLVRSGARTLIQLGAIGCQRQSKLPLEHFRA